jgi:cell wall assembly regulator SMI1
MSQIRSLAFRESSVEPPPVSHSWNRLGLWLKQNLPEVIGDLNPGATNEEIATFEEHVGQSLPPDVRESYLIHNGQVGNTAGVVFGLPIISLDDALRLWRHWEEGIRQEGTSLDKGCTSFPEGAIQLKYMNLGWIPLSEDGSGSHFGIDLDPGPHGTMGQVIDFGREEEDKCVLARRWGHFLADVADELERGNFLIEKHASGSEFTLMFPSVRHFLEARREWSKAKLGIM